MTDPALLLNELTRLRQDMLQCIGQASHLVPDVAAHQRLSAGNLLHYLAFRSHDVRALQDQLHAYGLSSMASSESHILAQIEKIMERLGWQPAAGELDECTFAVGPDLLERHALRLFGPRLDATIPHVMVTLEAASGDDPQALVGALEAGMTIARINAAHDSPADWARWIANVRDASVHTKIPCRIYMDLPGPKMRMTLLSGYDEKGRMAIAPGDEVRLVEHPSDVRLGERAVTCQERGIVHQLRDGTRVMLDDGKYEGVIRERGGDTYLHILRVTGKKPKLRDEKGINFPYADLAIRVLTDSDRRLLPFIAEHADMMGCSFVRNAGDVAEIREALAGFSKRPDLILKIETPEAVLNLPELMLTAMQDEVFGVMIARGDLAVEIGFQQLSDVQDKILWICEAAHVPVIWATQVLESMNKSGLATRSEITDAAHAFKAECVMLNKGEFIKETLGVLTDILRRAGGHRKKKRYTLRPLTVASEFRRRLD